MINFVHILKSLSPCRADESQCLRVFCFHILKSCSPCSADETQCLRVILCITVIDTSYLCLYCVYTVLSQVTLPKHIYNMYVYIHACMCVPIWCHVAPFWCSLGCLWVHGFDRKCRQGRVDISGYPNDI